MGGGCLVARESRWVLLLGRKAGLVTLGKGSFGLKEGKGTVVKWWAEWFGIMGGRRALLKRHLLCRPPGVDPPGRQSYFSGDHPRPQHILLFFTNSSWRTKARGAAASPWHCPQPHRVARQGAAAPRLRARAILRPRATSKACCRWPSRRALRSQTPLQNP